jgi:hypothetical protein
MIVWGTVGICISMLEVPTDFAIKSGDHTRCDIPSRGEGEQVSQWRSQVARLGGKNTENGRINVIDGDGAHINEFCEVIFIRNLSPG